MKYLLDSIYTTAKKAYTISKCACKTAAKCAKRAGSRIIRIAQDFYKRVKGGILAYIKGTYIYTRINTIKNIVEQAESSIPVPARIDWAKDYGIFRPTCESIPSSQENLEAHQKGQQSVMKQTVKLNEDEPFLLEWRPLKMSVDDFKQIRKLTMDSFQKQVKSLTCPISQQVMRKPSSMKCCRKLRKKSERYADKYALLLAIHGNKRCPLCHKEAKSFYVVEEDKLYTSVTGIRQRIAATYGNLDEKQKSIWRVLIDENFGPGYTEKHLDNQEN